MKKYLIFISLIMWFVDVCAYEYSADAIINSFDDTDIIIQNGVVIHALNGTSISTSGPVHFLHNYGTIDSAIESDYNLFIYNYNTGIISGGISSTANVVQIINPSTGFSNINVTGGNFSVRLEDMSNINFLDIKDFNTSNFFIENTVPMNTVITINNFSDWQNWNKNISVSGPISLVINDDNIQNYNGQKINNISNAESVQVYIGGLDPANRVDTQKVAGNFLLSFNRETDYNIMNNEENSALEELRRLHPNDRLLRALDSARNSAEIERIKRKSYRFNHGILLRPVKVINNFSLMDNIYNKNDFGLGFMPVYTVSDKISDIGGRVYIGNNYNDFYFNVGLSLHNFNYLDDINDFSGFLYGADFNFKAYFNKLWINGIGGANITNFKAIYISSTDGLKKNPYGVSWYSGLDIGYDFGHDFGVSPFVGLGYQGYKVIDVNDDDFYVRGGAEAKFSFVVDGIKYEYALDGAIADNGNLFSAIKIGFWSILDEAGATISAGMLKDEFDYNYQLSLNAKMLF